MERQIAKMDEKAFNELMAEMRPSEDAERAFANLPEDVQLALKAAVRAYLERLDAEDDECLRQAVLSVRDSVMALALDVLIVDATNDSTSRPFPIDALGPVLADVTRAAMEVAQCQPALAASTIVAHVAAAVQAIADIRTNKGRLLTSAAVMPIVESSDGKGIVHEIATRPFVEYEAWLKCEHVEFDHNFRAAMAVWVTEGRPPFSNSSRKAK